LRPGLEAEQLPVGEWRRAKVMLPPDMVVADGEKLLLHFSLLSLHEGISGVVVYGREVTKVAAEYFEKMWAHAGG